MPLFRALLYLRLTSLRNGLLGRLRRLRQPKYLVGAIAGALYFWFFFFRRRLKGRKKKNRPCKKNNPARRR